LEPQKRVPVRSRQEHPGRSRLDAERQHSQDEAPLQAAKRTLEQHNCSKYHAAETCGESQQGPDSQRAPSPCCHGRLTLPASLGVDSVAIVNTWCPPSGPRVSSRPSCACTFCDNWALV